MRELDQEGPYLYFPGTGSLLLHMVYPTSPSIITTRAKIEVTIHGSLGSTPRTTQHSGVTRTCWLET